MNNEMSPLEKWENATIANNFIFYKVMRNNPDICKEFLERLLLMKIDYIVMAQEEEIEVDLESKSIRMDVYAKNNNEMFNIEMQTADTGELAERARYYQGVMDVDNLKHGERYKSLKTSYIIFICIDDIFGKGLARYTFENICNENSTIKLRDRAFKYFFIARNYDKIMDEKQKNLLRLIMENKPADDFSGRVIELVKSAKTNARWRQKYMEYERQRTYDMDAGELRGIQKNKIENARNLIKLGTVKFEDISSAIGLPMEQILELAKEVEAEKISV